MNIDTTTIKYEKIKIPLNDKSYLIKYIFLEIKHEKMEILIDDNTHKLL